MMFVRHTLTTNTRVGRDAHTMSLINHKLMACDGIRAVKAELAKPLHEHTTFTGRPLAHNWENIGVAPTHLTKRQEMVW